MTPSRKNENVELPRGFEHRDAAQPRFQAAAPERPGPRPMGGGRVGIGRAMQQEPEKAKNVGVTLRRLLRYFGRSKRLLVFLLLAVVFCTVVSLVAPALQGTAIDLIAAHRWEKLKTVLVFLLCTYVFQMLFTLAQTLLSAHLSRNIVRLMRHDLFEKIDRLSIKYLDTHSSGDVMSRMTNDVENISGTVSQSIGSLISGVLTILGTVSIMFSYCWQLTLITMVSVLLTVFVTRKMSAAMRKLFRKRSKILGQLNGHAEEMITGYRSIVAYNKQKDVIAEFNHTSDELARAGLRAEILGGSMGPLMNAISNISFVLVAAFGGIFAKYGIITVGVISAFIIYAKQFSRPINEIAHLYGSVQTAIAGAERVFELMDQPDEDKSGAKKLENLCGQVSFKNVNFSYVPEKQVLHDFNLEVHPGQKIALVGATGSGKTTVVNLLMRFYPVDSGEILVDGVNIQELDRDELRRNTAIVLQDTVLFTDTVAGNILYADPNATQEQMLAAAEMSNAAYFIERLPQQYDTLLKQAGANLSQGQRQLLTIARAVLADPKILILDEATSSVDTRTEKSIQDAMVKLMKNRTSLIIAHRLSTVRDADCIVVMDGGRVVETGTHEELLQQKGRYYHLYKTQFSGQKT